MDIKGTRTEQNLWNAFSGESMARNKYLFLPTRPSRRVMLKWPSSLSGWHRMKESTAN